MHTRVHMQMHMHTQAYTRIHARARACACGLMRWARLALHRFLSPSAPQLAFRDPLQVLTTPYGIMDHDEASPGWSRFRRECRLGPSRRRLAALVFIAAVMAILLIVLIAALVFVAAVYRPIVWCRGFADPAAVGSDSVHIY